MLIGFVEEIADHELRPCVHVLDFFSLERSLSCLRFGSLIEFRSHEKSAPHNEGDPTIASSALARSNDHKGGT